MDSLAPLVYSSIRHPRHTHCTVIAPVIALMRTVDPNAPGDFHPGRAAILLPTCNVFDCSPAHETPGVIELRTLDFSRYRFHECVCSSGIEGSLEGSLDLEGRGNPRDLGPRIEEWRAAIKAAIKRVETVGSWDQGAAGVVREFRESQAAQAASCIPVVAPAAVELQTPPPPPSGASPCTRIWEKGA